jgi:ABC-2 type transport system ATP-binding protein
MWIQKQLKELSTMQLLEQLPPSAPDTAPVIWAHGLSKRYKKVTAVNGVSLEVQAGDVFGLLGPNGAGKTTLIRMLLGLVAPSDGEAKVLGYDPMQERAQILARTSAIIESPALYPTLSGRDNLIAMGKISGLEDPARIDWALETMGLQNRANDQYRTYSLGMKQRLCIAAALLNDPQLIILDEPTNGLDPAGMNEIRGLIRQLAGQGRTVVLCSHLLNEVQQVCNRVAIMKKGEIIMSGLVSDLLAEHTGLQIKVAVSQREAAAEVLRRNGWQDGLSLEDNYIVLERPDSEGAIVNEALAQHGIFASELTPRLQSLEDYFLKLTQE